MYVVQHKIYQCASRKMLHPKNNMKKRNNGDIFYRSLSITKLSRAFKKDTIWNEYKWIMETYRRSCCGNFSRYNLTERNIRNIYRMLYIVHIYISMARWSTMQLKLKYKKCISWSFPNIARTLIQYKYNVWFYDNLSNVYI